ASDELLAKAIVRHRAPERELDALRGPELETRVGELEDLLRTLRIENQFPEGIPELQLIQRSHHNVPCSFSFILSSPYPWGKLALRGGPSWRENSRFPREKAQNRRGLAVWLMPRSKRPLAFFRSSVTKRQARIGSPKQPESASARSTSTSRTRM